MWLNFCRTKLIYKRLYSFLDSCNILHSLQFGFREKHSTLHALIGMTETIKESIDNGTFGCGVFVDLQTAFDTVNHTILLQKLEHYSVRGNVLNWFSSYLCNRKQYASVNGATSNQLIITCGVPQGSVLGPLLFIYINDLPTVSRCLSFCLFADDLNIYFNSGDLFTLQKVMNWELKKVKKWLDAIQLAPALNIEKTNFVIFHSPQRKIEENTVIKFMRKKISRKTSVKFLGILLDAHLSWKQQITELSKKLARTIGILYKIRHFVLLETPVLYFSLFYSFVSYGIAVWGLTHKSLLNPLIISKKKVVRMMCFEEPTAHTEPLFKELQFLEVREIHELQLLSFIQWLSKQDSTCSFSLILYTLLWCTHY